MNVKRIDATSFSIEGVEPARGMLQVGERFRWPETDLVAVVERVTPCAAYVKVSRGSRHVTIRDATGALVREFDADISFRTAITPFACVERIA